MSYLLRIGLPALLLLTANATRAQDVGAHRLGDARPNAVQIRAGAEHGFVAGIGYGRTLRVAGHRLMLIGDLTMPWAELDAADYRVRAGVLTPLAGTRRWRLTGQAASLVRGLENELSRMTGLGVEVGLVGGWYGPRGFLGGEAGLDWAVASYIAHTDHYRSTVYPDARDGWYANPGGSFRYGLVGGVALGRHDLVLRVGQTRDANANVQLLPFYATLGLDVRF